MYKQKLQASKYQQVYNQYFFFLFYLFLQPIQEEKNINFPRQSNYPLSTHNNIKNSYNILSHNILKYFDTKLFFNNNINSKFKNKNFKPNKKFEQKKNNKNIINNVNSINNENYFRTNNNKKIKNNEDNKLFKNSVNNALNIKSFEYCLSSNTSKKKHLVVDKKPNNDNINNNYLPTNFITNRNSKNNISKKSFGNLKGNNYINNIFSENSKPILINTSHIRKNTETIKNKKNKNSISKNSNRLSNNSKSKNRKNNLLSHKINNLYNKDNLDNNIIINFNILKPNIILDHQRTSSRKTKNNKFGLTTHTNNFMSTKVDRPITESNFCTTVRNNFFNKSNKYKNCRSSNYKNIDLKQIKKSKEINKIIKSIQEVKKFQGNVSNNRKRINTEI